MVFKSSPRRSGAEKNLDVLDAMTKASKMREHWREEREEELEEDQASLKIHSCFHRLQFWLLKGSSRGSSLGI